MPPGSALRNPGKGRNRPPRRPDLIRAGHANPRTTRHNLVAGIVMLSSPGVTFRPAPMTRFRTIGLSAFAAVLLVGSASAQDRGGGFLEKLFGPSDRFAEPQGSAPGPGDDRSSQGAPGAQNRVPGDAASRFERLEATIRQLTGEIEQLQHRNQQLEAELRRIQGDPEYRSQSPSAGVRTQD